MTAYIITPEVHAQLLKALTTRDLRLHEKCEAMLKAMKPSEPKAWVIEFENGESELHFHDANNSLGETQVPLYAKEQQ